MTSLYITFQIILFLNFTSSVKKDCNPVENCRNYFLGNYVRDPEDCHSYYLCLKDTRGNLFPSDSPIKCEDGYYFYSGYCKTGSSCTNECINLCRAECTDHHFEKIADLQDCSSFYLCLPGGKREHHKCPDWKPFFDGFQCSDNKFVCCHNSKECTPYCEKSYYEIADPYDCKSFYYCSAIGVPPIENKYTCKEGQYFEPYTGKCEIERLLGSPCKPKCTTKETIGN